MAKNNESGTKSWRYAIIAVSVILVLAIAGTVYYGATVVPEQNKSRDVAACETFEAGYNEAKFAFISEMIQKKHTPDPVTAIQNYMEPLFIGSIRAAKGLPYESDLGKALIDLNVSKLTFDGSSAEAANASFHTYDNQAAAIQSLCYGLGVGTSASPSTAK